MSIEHPNEYAIEKMNAYLEERVIKAIKDFYKEDKAKEFDYWNPIEEMLKDFEKNWI